MHLDFSCLRLSMLADSSHDTNTCGHTLHDIIGMKFFCNSNFCGKGANKCSLCNVENERKTNVEEFVKSDQYDAVHSAVIMH